MRKENLPKFTKTLSGRDGTWTEAEPLPSVSLLSSCSKEATQSLTRGSDAIGKGVLWWLPFHHRATDCRCATGGCANTMVTLFKSLPQPFPKHTPHHHHHLCGLLHKIIKVWGKKQFIKWTGLRESWYLLQE